MLGTRTILAGVLCPVLACGGERAACLPLVEGVPIVTSAGAAAGEATRFDELWRRGGTRESEELGLPIGVVPGPGGHVVIPDFQLAELILVGGDGSWRGNIARAGAGPGEVRLPAAAAWREDGTLVVFDLTGSRIVTLAATGEPVAADIRLDASFAGPTVARGELDGVALQPSGAPVLLTHFEKSTADGTFTDEVQGLVLRLDPTSGRVDTLATPVYPIVFAGAFGKAPVPGWPRPVAAVGPDGRLAVAASDGSYRVLVYDADARPLFQMCGAGEPPPLSEREVNAGGDPARGELSAAFRAARRPARPAAFGRIVVAADGGLWVQRDRPGMFGAPLEGVLGVPGAQYDVFDADGRLLRTLTAPAAVRIQAVSGDTVWAFETGARDEVWLVVYRIVTETS